MQPFRTKDLLCMTSSSVFLSPFLNLCNFFVHVCSSLQSKRVYFCGKFAVHGSTYEIKNFNLSLLAIISSAWKLLEYSQYHGVSYAFQNQ